MVESKCIPFLLPITNFKKICVLKVMYIWKQLMRVIPFQNVIENFVYVKVHTRPYIVQAMGVMSQFVTNHGFIGL